jgi:uncharacterized protein YceH (UPF0502 family)
MQRPALSDDADTTRRLNALQQEIADLTQRIEELESA